MLNIPRPNSAVFLAGGGVMGALTRGYDLSASPPGKAGSMAAKLAHRATLDTKKALMRGLCDQFNWRYHDVAAGDLPRLLGIMLEKIPLLQSLDRLLIGRRGEVIIARIVTGFHAAVADFSFQFGIIVERGNEPGDFLVPFFRGAVGKLIFDHEVFHRLLFRCRIAIWRRADRRHRGISQNADGDDHQSDRHIAPVRNGLVRRSWPMLEPGPWPQMKLTSSPSGSSFSVID